MMKTFKYRLVKASWAVAIDIAAESSSPSAVPGDAINVKDRLWLMIVPRWLSKEERQQLRIGLSLVADSILRSPRVATRGLEPLLVRVLDVSFNPCHYQAEGLAAAIAGWAAQEFAFRAVDFPITLDRVRKRYIYRFQASGAPLGVFAFGVKLAASANWTKPIAESAPMNAGRLLFLVDGSTTRARVQRASLAPPMLVGHQRQVPFQTVDPSPKCTLMSIG